MPSRCIFFFSAFSAWSMLLSRTMICKGCSWQLRGSVGSYQTAFFLSTAGRLNRPWDRPTGAGAGAAIQQEYPHLSRSSGKFAASVFFLLDSVTLGLAVIRYLTI